MSWIQCAKILRENYHNYPCSRKGVIEREGKWYCKQHDPVARKARDAASYAKFQKDIAERARAIRLEMAAPDLLYAINLLMDALPIKRDWLDPITEKVAIAAIAKAEGRER